jgi:CheY-like chemotaxis protein
MLVLDSIEFDLRGALDDMVGLLAPRAHEKGLELATEIAPDVPARVIGDPGRMRQVIVNLVSNAIKFTEKGEVVIRVEADGRVEGKDVVRFTVADTGIGIPLDKQATIFESFTQADSSMTRRFGGTGLGLTIASQLTQLMGGHIGVDSQPGVGSQFHVAIPFAMAMAASTASPKVAPLELAGIRVLVVDDNRTNRQILDRMLRVWGMDAAMADGGARALEALEDARLENRPFALVLLDFQMPDMDGFAVAARIKERPELAATTIMMLSSVGQRGDGVRCRELGLAAYLTKPVRRPLLYEAICTALATGRTPGGEVTLVTRHSLREARRSLHILLAEDNAVNSLLATTLLKKAGHTVARATTGREAVHAAADQRFDVILMDVQMPDMDGLEATAAIRRAEEGSGEHTPIISLTAHAMAGDRQRCLEAGADGYLAKPFVAEQLLAALDEALGLGDPLAIDAPTPGRAPADPAGSEPARRDFAVDDLMARVDGDRGLLAELVGLLRAESPRLLAEIQRCVEAGDAPALRIAAHAIKGTLGNFGDSGAARTALTLEVMGRDGVLDGAAAGLGVLGPQVESLERSLVRFLEETPA